METNVITLEEALHHLEDRIPSEANCKKEVVDLIKWVIAWNPNRSQRNKVFCFLREFEGRKRDERVNVAFALDRDGNQQKTNKPNFLVIKLSNTDREFKGLHVDFDLTDQGYSQLSMYLVQRQSNLRRWIAQCSEITKMGFDDLQELFLVAYDRKGGVA